MNMHLTEAGCCREKVFLKNGADLDVRPDQRAQEGQGEISAAIQQQLDAQWPQRVISSHPDMDVMN